MIEIATRTTRNSYRFDVVPITAENRFDVMARVEPFHEQLKLAKGRTLRELYSNVDVGAEAEFVVAPGEQDVAVIVNRVKEINISGHTHKVLMRLLRVVPEEYQNQGFGSALTDDPIERHNPDAITGRTFNPLILYVDERSPLIGVIYPIHRLPNTEAKLLLVATLDEKSRAETDLATLICKGVYPIGRTGIFNPDELFGRPLEIYNRWIELGFDLYRGDGIRYLAMRRHPRGRARWPVASPVSSARMAAVA